MVFEFNKVDGVISVQCKCYDSDNIDDYVIQQNYNASFIHFMNKYESITFSVDTNVTYRCPNQQIDENSCVYVVSYYIKKYLNTNITNSSSDIEVHQ